MKKQIPVCILFLAFQTLFGQVITSEPAFPTVNDSIIIYFDASQAVRQDLVGYNGDLYVHTGVNSTAGDWKHVVGTDVYTNPWGHNDVEPKLTRLYNDVYKLVIGYPREFYSVTSPSEKIYSFCFVFRSSDGSKQT
ncbi:MAG: Por secretion system protein, partial [Candidatus Marinimicrobia bacterium]|nr:Por secretion system protein [Candidatus Neomarinimicrobiota bacterium]